MNVGDIAPDFTLGAANMPEPYTLSEIIAAGPAVVEFLRGTW